MERIFYISLGAALCITGIWGIIREFIPEKYRLFKKGRKEKWFFMMTNTRNCLTNSARKCPILTAITCHLRISSRWTLFCVIILAHCMTLKKMWLFLRGWTSLFRQAQAVKQHVLPLTFGAVQCMTQIHLKLISTRTDRKNMCRANTMLLTIFSTAHMRRITSRQSKSGSKFLCE